MSEIINEGLSKLKVAKKAAIVSKQMDVFYNPIMSTNRDISILLLNSINKSNLQVADPLAASGIRSIRFAKELKNGKLSSIYLNDFDKKSVDSIISNLKLNKIRYITQKNNCKKSINNDKKTCDVFVNNKDANLFLLNSTGFDYIDIDPFGSPNQFLDSAIRRLAREGTLAVTATDTSALCGTYINACKRKYWATPRKGSIMHETGLRILIRKVQLVAAQYEKALTPIFSYSKDHYMRIFFNCAKGKSKADKILNEHNLFENIGPMWTGQLWDKKLCSQMHENAVKNKIFNKNIELIRFLKTIKEESKIDSLGFYDIHDICSKYKIKNMTTKEEIILKIKKTGYNASNTHFLGHGIRSDMGIIKLIKIIKKKK
jgi:tRNA (guanine26-N2/guanine27-N2)-dimethyltransferase